jgi:hypothetical protein
MYAGRKLHQWHAHGPLPWLAERNVVGAFEALVTSKAVQDIGDFCNWIGDLSARIHAGDHAQGDHGQGVMGAWDQRLPSLFWGDAYVKFLLGEAGRTKEFFDKLANGLVQKIGGSVSYKAAANKNYGRVSKKQMEYASFGLLAQHAALDHMCGCFHRLLRAEPDGEITEVRQARQSRSSNGALLILGSLVPGQRTPEDSLADVENAISFSDQQLQTTPSSNNLSSSQPSPLSNSGVKQPIVVLLSVHKDYQAQFEEGKTRLLQCGAGAVKDAPSCIEDPADMAKCLREALDEACSMQGVSPPQPEKVSLEKLQVMFEMQKAHTKAKDDMLCAGGLLDLVRGSVTCHTEEDVRNVYEAALDWTLAHDGADVVRVKNGFHKPAVGGYCDLKLFVQVSEDHGEENRALHHICELQVHLKDFLDKKKYTHMPYVVDRGDFDDS